MMKRTFVFLFGIVIIVGSFLACGGSDNTGTKANTANTTGNTSTQHFKVGDTVKVGDTWQVVINSAKTAEGGQFSTLKQGDVYLLIDVSLTNTSNKEQTTSSLAEWKLTGTDGQSYNTTYDQDAPSAPDGKVEASSPAKGTLVYEVPSTVKEFRLAFAPSLFSSGQTMWDINVS